MIGFVYVFLTSSVTQNILQNSLVMIVTICCYSGFFEYLFFFIQQSYSFEKCFHLGGPVATDEPEIHKAGRNKIMIPNKV